MSEPIPSTSTGTRSLRPRGRPTTRRSTMAAPSRVESKLPKKRKKSNNADSMTDVLEDVGVSVGPGASRERVLALLNQYVKKKKPRRSVHIRTSIQPRSTTAHTQQSGNSTEVGDLSGSEHQEPIDVNNNSHDLHSAHPDPIPIESNNVDNLDFEGQDPPKENNSAYEKFDNKQLSQMLGEVGVETLGLSREQLIHNCKIYDDLIIPPSSCLDNPQKISSSMPKTVRFEPASTSSATSPGLRAGSTSATIESPRVSSTSDLPNLQHRRFLYPRPLPTVLFPCSGPSNHGKDKSKATHSDSDDSYDPEKDKDVSDDEDVGFSPGQTRNRPHGDQEKEFGASTENVEHGDKGSRSSDNEKKILEDIRRSSLIANKKIDSLATSLKALSGVVKQMIDSRREDSGAKEIKGGRTSARIRFHIETMIGNKSDADCLPPPPAPADKETWECDKDLDDYEVNLAELEMDDEEMDRSMTDPYFPYYPDGPGHKDSNPLQLSIIWKLMNVVGVTSFRPDFSTSASSKDNKWLWGLSLKIFYKLVEYGVYTGVSLDEENRTYIKKCFDTHIQSLMKRYRQEGWDDERRQMAAVEAKRTTRTHRLRKAREEIILLKEELWPLLPILSVSCSDDETDVEVEPSGENHSPGKGKPIVVRKSNWRNMELEKIWKRIDSCKTKVKLSIPTGSGPSKAGRRPRPRIRRDNAPASRIEAPVGQPIDCYSQSFLDGLTPTEKVRLDIDPVPVLPKIVGALNDLGW